MSESKTLGFSKDHCRICNRDFGVFLDIFRSLENRKYYKEIEECLSVKVSKQDNVSLKVCHRCVYNLKLCSEFVDQFNTTHHILKTCPVIGSCYFCLRSNCVLFDIESHADEAKCTICKIEKCFSPKVPAGLNISRKLCLSCAYRLDILYELRETAFKTQKLYVKTLGKKSLIAVDEKQTNYRISHRSHIQKFCSASSLNSNIEVDDIPDKNTMKSLKKVKMGTKKNRSGKKVMQEQMQCSIKLIDVMKVDRSKRKRSASLEDERTEKFLKVEDQHMETSRITTKTEPGTPIKRGSRSPRRPPGKIDTETPTKTLIKSNILSPRRTPVKNVTQSPRRTSLKSDTQSPRRTPVKNDTQSSRRTPVKNNTQSPRRKSVKNDARSPRRKTPVKNDTQSPRRTSVKNDTRSPRRTPIKINKQSPGRTSVESFSRKTFVKADIQPQKKTPQRLKIKLNSSEKKGKKNIQIKKKEKANRTVKKVKPKRKMTFTVGSKALEAKLKKSLTSSETKTQSIKSNKTKPKNASSKVGEKFKCSVCNVTFSKKINVQVHELSHKSKVPMLVLKRCGDIVTNVKTDVTEVNVGQINETQNSTVYEKLLEESSSQVAETNEDQKVSTSETVDKEALNQQIESMDVCEDDVPADNLSEDKPDLNAMNEKESEFVQNKVCGNNEITTSNEDIIKSDEIQNNEIDNINEANAVQDDSREKPTQDIEGKAGTEDKSELSPTEDCIEISKNNNEESTVCEEIDMTNEHNTQNAVLVETNNLQEEQMEEESSLNEEKTDTGDAEVESYEEKTDIGDVEVESYEEKNGRTDSGDAEVENCEEKSDTGDAEVDSYEQKNGRTETSDVVDSYKEKTDTGDVEVESFEQKNGRTDTGDAEVESCEEKSDTGDAEVESHKELSIGNVEKNADNVESQGMTKVSEEEQMTTGSEVEQVAALLLEDKADADENQSVNNVQGDGI